MINNRRYKIGNAQTIGRREIESNYFSTAYNDAGNLLAVLADGTIDHPNGRRAAIMAVEHCVYALSRYAQQAQANQYMLETALQVNKRIKDEIYTGTTPRLSLAMILLANNTLSYFNVGANRIYLYNGYNERVLGDNPNGSYSKGGCELSAKNVIGILSAGVHTVTHPMERIRLIGAEQEIYDKAQSLIETVRGKGLNNQLNATALLIEVVK